MQNRKKQDNISVDVITPDNNKAVSQKNVGSAEKNSFCLYDHKRHAVGSKILNQDGSETVCTEDSSWKNT